MNPDKKEQLRSSLLSELARQTERGHFGPSERVKWLGDQLENYVERWVAFTAVLPARKSSLADDMLFGIVEIGSKVLGAELETLKDPGNIKSWQNFLAMLDHIRCEGDGKKAPELKEAFARVRAEIGSLPK